jgi:hypothetical protein
MAKKLNRKTGKAKESTVPKRSAKAPALDYERLAKMKVDLKKLEEDTKDLQKQIIADGGAKEIETAIGWLKLQTRENWEIVDKNQILGTMGNACFMQNCSISKAGIVKGIGERGFKQLTGMGAVGEKPKTTYYTLKIKK